MVEIESYVELKHFLLNLNSSLFPEQFEFLSRDLLFESTMELTHRINKVLKDYHELTELAKKFHLKPVLIFSQDLLAQMSRLLKFETKHLTSFNQILMDLKEMLLNQEQLLQNKYLAIAEREMKLMQDDKFRKTLEATFQSFLVDLDKKS